MIIIRDEDRSFRVYEDENGTKTAYKMVENPLPWTGETDNLEIEVNLESRDIRYVENDGNNITVIYRIQCSGKDIHEYKKYNLEKDILEFHQDFTSFFTEGAMPIKNEPDEGPMAFIGDGGLFLGECKNLIIVTGMKKNALKTTVGFVAECQQYALEKAEEMKKSGDYISVLVETYSGDARAVTEV